MYSTTITYQQGKAYPLQKQSSCKQVSRVDDELEEGVELELDSNEDDQQVEEEELVSAQKVVEW